MKYRNPGHPRTDTMHDRYRLNHILYTIIQFTWGLPQNLAGLMVFLFLFLINPKRKIEYFHGAVVSYWKFGSSMTLGMFIFYGHWVHEENYAKAILIHEYGHTIQSLMLGPLFSPVVGFPSMWAHIPIFEKWRGEGRYSYFDLYCEKWANYEGCRVLGVSMNLR